MEDEKSLKSDNKKQYWMKLIIFAVFLFLFLIFVSVFIFVVKNSSDPASAAVIRIAAALQLGKDPNELTDPDFAKITSLDFYRKRFSDIKLLKKFKNLEQLSLSETDFVEPVIPEWKALLVKIRVIKDPGNYIDLSPLKKLRKLQLLVIINQRINDIRPLSKLTNLKDLQLTQTQLSDLEPIKRLPNLQKLYVDGTQVSDIEPLRELTDLRELSIGSTHVTNLEPIKELTKLQKLVVRGTQVHDLEPLRELTNLQELYISSTPVANLEPIKGLTKLLLLNIQLCNNISDKQVEELQKALPHLRIQRALGR